MILIIGFLLLFKNYFFKLNKTNDKSFSRFKQLLQNVLVYGLAIMLIIGILELAQKMNYELGKRLIENDPVEQNARYLGIISKKKAYSVKGIQTDFYAFEYLDKNKIIINGLEIDNDENKESFKNQILNNGAKFIHIKNPNDSVFIEYSADFPTFFRIK